MEILRNKPLNMTVRIFCLCGCLALIAIGLAQLAMHSCFETAGARDTESLVRFAEAFYGEPLPAVIPE
jgi:hypothetical protein